MVTRTLSLVACLLFGTAVDSFQPHAPSMPLGRMSPLAISEPSLETTTADVAMEPEMMAPPSPSMDSAMQPYEPPSPEPAAPSSIAYSWAMVPGRMKLVDNGDTGSHYGSSVPTISRRDAQLASYSFTKSRSSSFGLSPDDLPYTLTTRHYAAKGGNNQYGPYLFCVDETRWVEAERRMFLCDHGDTGAPSAHDAVGTTGRRRF